MGVCMAGNAGSVPFRYRSPPADRWTRGHGAGGGMPCDGQLPSYPSFTPLLCQPDARCQRLSTEHTGLCARGGYGLLGMLWGPSLNQRTTQTHHSNGNNVSKGKAWRSMGVWKRESNLVGKTRKGFLEKNTHAHAHAHNVQSPV